ncbi:MAG: hypothetical protein A2283_09110 [Lentisphaerae bacterium RIFOXYA12_FULL_48_11]|nr:MAG: hypothetical protein A2283_09110 [Lentisphaerae bacterium RIFOXYA12_FULL_48_11]
MKPKILLVNPPVYDFTAHDFWLKPYGLLEVAGFLRGRAEMKLFDYLDRTRMPATREKDKWGRGKYISEEIPKPPCLQEIRRRYQRFGLKREMFQKFITGNGPFDFVLIQTVMTYWYPGLKEVIEDIRHILPGAKIILGGIYATLCYTHATSLGADLIIRGTELSPLWQMLSIEPDIRQPAFWQGYWDLQTGTIRLSDGCPFSCSYCSVQSIYPAFTPRAQERCTHELDLMKSKNVQNIAFYDDALLHNPDICLMPFLQYVLSKQYKFNFHTPNALNARLITPELAGLMIKAGVKTFYLGFESMSEEWQKNTGNKVLNDDIIAAVNNLIKAGADTSNIFAYIIAGHPDHNIQKVRESMNFVHNLGINIMLSEYSPVPGTKDSTKCQNLTSIDEPLMHNKTAFTIRSLGESEVQQLKLLCKELNGRK